MEVETVTPRSMRPEGRRRLARWLRLVSGVALVCTCVAGALAVLGGVMNLVRSGLELAGWATSPFLTSFGGTYVTLFAAQCAGLMLVWFYTGYFARALEQAGEDRGTPERTQENVA